MRFRYWPMVLVCSLFPCTLGQAHEGMEDVVPVEECACEIDIPLEQYPPLACVLEYQCWVSHGPALPFTQQDRELDERHQLDCDNCAEPCNPMVCFQTLCVTKTDGGTVTGTAGFSTAFKAEINCALAGKVGIETTAEFASGESTTTTRSWEHCVQCGSPAIRPCTATTYLLESYKTPRTAQVPLYHRWVTRVCCPEPGPWRDASQCGLAGYATINAHKGSVSGCIAVPIDCATPCPDCISLP